MNDFTLFGNINLEQTLMTLSILATVFIAYKPLLKLIQKKIGLTINSTRLEIDNIKQNKLYTELLDIYRTSLTGQTVDEQIIQMEEMKYTEYARLGGNGFVDKARGRWQEHVVDILLDGPSKEDTLLEKSRRNKV